MRQLEQGTPVCDIWPNKTEHLLGHLYNLDTIGDLEKMEQLKDFARFGVISLIDQVSQMTRCTMLTLGYR
jgi:hypothetical protein